MRFLPAAVTPIEWKDLFQAMLTFRKLGLDEFEQAMCSYLGVRKAYTFTSFMRAIYVCLISLKRIDPREEVIIPRFSCPTFAHAVIAAGLKIKYCDINPDTLSFDMDYLSKMDLRNVLALICVNHFGLANPMAELVDFCKSHGIYLVEDLGYSLGTEYEGKKLGSFGDFSVLNFQEGKALPIGGGMVTTNHDGILEKVLPEYRKQGKPNVLIMLGYKLFSNPHLYFLLMKSSQFLNLNLRKRFSMEDTIRSTCQEFDFRFELSTAFHAISNFQAALGCLILSKLDQHMRIREKNARLLASGLAQCKNVQLIKKEPGVSKIHFIRFPILVKPELRHKVLGRLLDKGIEASPMYCEHGMRINAEDFPGAKKVADGILTLPCHPGLNVMDLKKVPVVIRGAEGE